MYIRSRRGLQGIQGKRKIQEKNEQTEQKRRMMSALILVASMALPQLADFQN